MKVTNGTITYELKNDIQISAFLNSGWVEVKEKKVNTRKSS